MKFMSGMRALFSVLGALSELSSHNDCLNGNRDGLLTIFIELWSSLVGYGRQK